MEISRNLMRRVPAWAILLPLSLAAAGCGTKGVAGKWSGTAPVPGMAGKSAATVYDFKPDGTETVSVSLPFGPAGAIKMDGAGTYTIKDDTLTQTVSTITFNGRALPLPPQAKSPHSFKFKRDGDTLTLTSSDTPTPFTLKQVKE